MHFAAKFHEVKMPIYYPAGAGSYTLPIASPTVLGGVKVDGTTITSNNGVISAAGASGAADITSGTIDGAEIGGTTPAAGAFTTLSASGHRRWGEL